MDGWDTEAPAAAGAEESANPFAAPAADAPGAQTDAAPAPGAAPEQAAAAEAPAAPPVEPIDPELFSGPPVADSYAPAGTGVHGQSAQPDDGHEDARVKWRRENAQALEAKEGEEKKANDEVRATAKDWLAQFADDRATRIAQAKKDNLAQESSATKGPQGDTEWAKVNSMIDFTFKPPQEREAERERFKSLLFAAKTKNVPVKI